MVIWRSLHGFVWALSLTFGSKLYDDTQKRSLSMKKSRYFLGEFLMQKIHELHIVIFYDNTQDS